MKIAFLFPGQGSQMCSMGESFYNNSDEARNVFENAGKLLDIDMKKLCFEENDYLDLTEYTQPAMVTTMIAMLKFITGKGLKADTCLGLSLGEYVALYYSGAITESDAIKVVAKRGKLMQQELPLGFGSMAAILNTDTKLIEEILENIDGAYIANYNCPGQIVISGEKKAIEKACSELKAKGVKKILPLNVSGPFHSELLKGAGEKLYEYLKNINIENPKIPYVANYNAEFVKDKSNIKELLRDQVYSSVKFNQSIDMLIDDGVDIFIEIGPKKTLSSFVKKINKDVKVYNIENIEDVATVIEAVKNSEGK